ncbi:hypothetical protein BC941DRAFT_418258 [Chlamydoabsidia padenii]|nr:hypothetical protein BC941DRAFT_418258 [Chlamydoabsidia padenii]
MMGSHLVALMILKFGTTWNTTITTSKANHYHHHLQKVHMVSTIIYSSDQPTQMLVLWRSN